MCQEFLPIIWLTNELMQENEDMQEVSLKFFSSNKFSNKEH